jgi:large conductance mechanosensitive channel
MDLAVGVIIGAAFGKIVDSVVNDLIMPVVGMAFSADFSNLYIPLSSKVSEAIAKAPNQMLALAEAKKIGPVFAWGNFVTIVLNFFILASIIFLIVKAVNKLLAKKEEAPAPPPAPSASEVLLAEIRDLLKNK